MTRETLQWLHWLVSSQSVQVGASDALQLVQRAQTALAEIEAALIEQEELLPQPSTS